MKLIIISLLIFLQLNLYSQTVKIIDLESNEGIPFVLIADENIDFYENTDLNGKLEISSLKDSKQILLSHMGYETKRLSYSEIKENAFNVYLSPINNIMDEIVISSNKWYKKKDDIISKIATINRNEIAFKNGQTSADLLGNSGEVYIQKSQQGGGSPMVRGFSTNRLIYIVDGIRMNNAIFRSGNLQNVISLDPFEMENVEVLFGPASVTYGSDAIGGVMSFNTLNPKYAITDQTRINTNSTLRYSSINNEKTGHLDYNLASKNIAYIGSFTFSDYGDLIMGSDGPDDYLSPIYVSQENGSDLIVNNPNPKKQIPSGYDQLNFMQKLRFKLSADWDLTFAHHYSKTSEYGRYDRHLRTKNNQPRYAEWDYGPQFWSMSSLKLNHISTSKLYDEVNILGAFQKFEESRISRDFNDNIRNIQEETVDAYSLNIDFKKTLKGNTELYYGIETVYNKVESIASDLDISNNNSAESQSRYPNSDWIGLAGYFSFEKSVFKNTRLNTGIRFNHFYLKSDFSNNLIALPFDVAKLNNNALNVNIGLVNKLNENTKISLNIANAFRAPNVDDIGKVFDSAPGIVIVPNPTLKAEIAYNADINIEKRFNNNAKISLGGYYTYLDNAMVRRDYTLNDQDSIVYLGELSKVQAIQNAAFVKVVGLNLNCSYPLSDLFILKAKLNLQHGVEELDDKTENPARHEAPTFGELEMIYSANNFKVALSYMHNLGKSFEDLPLDEIDKPEIYAKNADGNPYSPAYGILSLKSQYTISSNFTINVGLENIADIRYKSYSSGLAGAGRNLVTSINIHF